MQHEQLDYERTAGREPSILRKVVVMVVLVALCSSLSALLMSFDYTWDVSRSILMAVVPYPQSELREPWEHAIVQSLVFVTPSVTVALIGYEFLTGRRRRAA